MLGNQSENISRKILTQFAILRHEYPAGDLRRDHWDLLLEPPKTTAEAPLLLCFAIQAPVVEWNGSLVQKLPDHRRLYLHYEGPISNDRGFVQRIATGDIDWREITADTLRCNLKCTPTNSPSEWRQESIRCELRKKTIAQLTEEGDSFHPNGENLEWWRLEWRPQSL